MPVIPWDQVREVVDAALDLPANERASFLTNACPQSTVRRYVESLILSYEQAGDFLNDSALLPEQPAGWQGRRIGPYEIIDQIGEGGMGAVFRARRADDQYEKQVAIKLIRGTVHTRFTLAKFKAERQILANLEHPNIARLLDGGSTEDNEPYFVMEYIEGEPLDQYCETRRLNEAERLRLFRAVCSAVQYAHQNLVIHRDLKPGNILVTADGVPKLLDFGIAKLLTPDTGSAEPAQTVTMARLLTPEYASPEQERGENITTASDVYSLGIVLYELLTGHRPSGTERTQLRGDLDNIVQMALRDTPERRYASVEQFSEDIRRYLEGLPVIARPDTLSYRTSKFIKRNKAGVAAAVLLLLTLIGGLAATAYEARIARAQQQRAEARFNDVRKLANALMFDIHDAIQEVPGATKARQLLITNALTYLDSLAKEVQSDITLQRELADAYERMGKVQGQPFAANLGDTRGALASYRKAQEIRKAIAGRSGNTSDQVNYAKNFRAVAALQARQSNESGAIQSGRNAVALSESLLKNNPDNREVLAELAADYGDLASTLDDSGAGDSRLEAEAEQDSRKAMQIDEKLTAGSKDPKLLRNLAVTYLEIGRHLRDTGYPAEARQVLTKALAITRSLLPVRGAQAQWDSAAVYSNLGDTFMTEGNASDALTSYQHALDTTSSLAAADPKDGMAQEAVSEENLAVGIALTKLGKPAEGLRHLSTAIARFENEIQLDPRSEGANLDLTAAYVWAAPAQHSQRAAMSYFEKASAISRRMAHVDPSALKWPENEAEVSVALADYLRRHAELDQAAASYRHALAIAEPLLASHGSEDEPRYALTGAYAGLGQICAARGQRSDAASWQRRADDMWRTIRHPATTTPNGFNCLRKG